MKYTCQSFKVLHTVPPDCLHSFESRRWAKYCKVCRYEIRKFYHQRYMAEHRKEMQTYQAAYKTGKRKVKPANSRPALTYFKALDLQRLSPEKMLWAFENNRIR